MKQLNYYLYEGELLMTQFGTFAYITDVSEGYIYCLRVNLLDSQFQWFDFYTVNGMLDLTEADPTLLFCMGG